jgi:hypothetical protein
MKTKILKTPLTILVLIFTFSNCSDSSISAEKKTRAYFGAKIGVKST